MMESSELGRLFPAIHAAKDAIEIRDRAVEALLLIFNQHYAEGPGRLSSVAAAVRAHWFIERANLVLDAVLCRALAAMEKQDLVIRMMQTIIDNYVEERKPHDTDDRD